MFRNVPGIAVRGRAPQALCRHQALFKLASLSRGRRFLRGLLLDIRWDSLIRWEYLHRSVAKLAILLRGGRFLRGLLLDIRWEAVNRSAADIRWDSFSRSVAKPAILFRGTRFLRGLLLDGRWDISTERGQAGNSASRGAIPERVAA